MECRNLTPNVFLNHYMIIIMFSLHKRLSLIARCSSHIAQFVTVQTIVKTDEI